MKLEWYSYGPATNRLSPPMVRERLPASIQARLMNRNGLDYGVAVEPHDDRLVAEIDALLGVGRNPDILRSLRAEADLRSIDEYDFYVVSPQALEYRPRQGADIGRDCTPDRYVRAVEYSWPMLDRGIRELRTTLDDPYTRVIVVSSGAKAAFEEERVVGVRYTPLPDGLWMMDVSSRIPCAADRIVAPDLETTTRSVAGPYLFGLRYEPADFGGPDLLLVDRINVGNEVYRYRMPWLVASSRFVKLCTEQHVDRLLSPRSVFGRGFVPVLVGRGRVTSTLAL